MSMFLFCDHGFGWEFSKLAIRQASLRGIDLTIVYSARRTPQKDTPLLTRIGKKLHFGRRRALIWAAARRAGVRVIEIGDINSEEFVSRIQEPSHGIVAGFSQLFRQPAIDCFTTLANFHPSILPYYRGAIPSYWVLKNGERASGFTLHGITSRIDSGPILYQEVVPCENIQSPEALNMLIARKAMPAFERYIAHLAEGTAWRSVVVDANTVYQTHLDYGRKLVPAGVAVKETVSLSPMKPPFVVMGLKDRPPVLMIIAAGPLQLPAFQEARSAGCRLIAVDGRDTAPGMKLADRAYTIDIKRSDAVVEIARREGVTGVTSICTDFAVRTVAAVAHALGLPGPEPAAACRATDKRLMRRAFAECGVPSAQFAEVSDLAAARAAAWQIGYPVALKIPRSAGSRGVYRVDGAGALAERYEQARVLEPAEDLLVEQWLSGPEVSVEGCCVGREPRIVQITDKMLFPGPVPVEAGHTQPSRLSPESQRGIRRATIAGVRALGLQDCGFHAELKVTSAGARVIEIAARLGGDFIATHLTPLSTGINLVKAVIDLALGTEPSLEATRRRGSAIRYFQLPGVGLLEQADGLGKLTRFEGLEHLSTRTERGEPLQPGLRVSPVLSSLDRFGYVVFGGQDANDAARRADAAVSSVSFTVRHLSKPLEAESISRSA